VPPYLEFVWGEVYNEFVVSITNAVKEKRMVSVTFRQKIIKRSMNVFNEHVRVIPYE